MTAPAERTPGERVQMTVSQRDAAALAEPLRDWLGARLGSARPPVLSNVRMPASGGLSSTSLMFEASWQTQEGPRSGSFVARMGPEDQAVPV